MKHTKGNWTIKPSPSESSSGWTAIECSDEVIAEVYGSDEESQALASLIASAPELLQALIDMRNMVNCWTPPSGDKDKEQSKKIVCNAIDIIAKAEAS